MNSHSNNKETLFKNWAKDELNVEILDSDIPDLLEENKYLSKLLMYSQSRVRNKKLSQKIITYTRAAQICDELESNNQYFKDSVNKINEQIKCDDDADLDHFQKLHKLFQLTTDSVLNNSLKNFDPDSSLSYFQTKNAEINDLLQIIQRYCQCESVDKFYETDEPFNRYFYKSIKPALTEDCYNQTFSEISQNISVLLQDISDCCEKISEVKTNANFEVSDSVASDLETKTASNLKHEFETIKGALKNWIALIRKIDDKINHLDLNRNC